MISIVVTDLDGTLLRSDSKFNDSDIDALRKLGEKCITRVIATGRSPYSAAKVLPSDFPIDFLIFSSGAGVIRWSDKSIIHSNHLTAGQVQQIIDQLIEMQVDFMVHDPIPFNHYFYYYQAGPNNSDFLQRISLYSEYAQPLIVGLPFPSPASQVIAILPPDVNRFNNITQHLPNVHFIRATSPIDGKSIWLEILPQDVSKAGGVKWLCSYLNGAQPSNVLALGNDFNDLDMLELAGDAFIVENAPMDLRQKFKNVPSNNEAGFSYAVKKILE